MAIKQSALLDDSGAAVGQMIFLQGGLAVDITINGRRYLQTGFIETDTNTYDTNAHQGAFAGSATRTTQGGAVGYVRIT